MNQQIQQNKWAKANLNLLFVFGFSTEMLI